MLLSFFMAYFFTDLGQKPKQEDMTIAVLCFMAIGAIIAIVIRQEANTLPDTNSLKRVNSIGIIYTITCWMSFIRNPIEWVLLIVFIVIWILCEFILIKYKEEEPDPEEIFENNEYFADVKMFLPVIFVLLLDLLLIDNSLIITASMAFGSYLEFIFIAFMSKKTKDY